MTEKAVRYLRVSTDRQDEQNQIKFIDKMMEEKGWELATSYGVNGTYKDHGFSAFKENVVRPDFEKMLKDTRKREFQHIVVFDLDRFSRKKAQDVLDLIKQLRLLYGVEVNAVFGDEWRDLVNMINNIPNMGFIGKPLAEFLESVIVGMKAYDAHLFSEKLSDSVKESTKYQKALRKGNVGRPKVPPIIILKVKALLLNDVPYESIRDQCEYKTRGGKVVKISRATVSLIKTGKKEVENV